MSKSKIEWTDQTWNPMIGCLKISEGCKNCYAEKMYHRLVAMKARGYEGDFNRHNPIFIESTLKVPLMTKKPTTFFVCSMSDLFHSGNLKIDIDKVFSVISKCERHTFQILTKRPENMLEYSRMGNMLPENVILGVSVENKAALNRIKILNKVKGDFRRFLSIEPLLEDLGKIDLTRIDLVIVGGENTSKAKARPMKKEWVLNIKAQCDARKVPFFFKQWGNYSEKGELKTKKANGRLIDGVQYNDRIRSL